MPKFRVTTCYTVSFEEVVEAANKREARVVSSALFDLLCDPSPARMLDCETHEEIVEEVEDDA